MGKFKFLSEWFGNLKTKIKLGKKNFNEVKELMTDLKQNLGYKDVKLNIKSKENVVVTATKDVNNLSVDMNFATGEMVQRQVGKSHVLVPSFMLPKQENTTIVRGTLDGNIKRVKNINLRSNNEGAFREVTDIENRVTGNTYRRTKTPAGTVYEKFVNGNYVNLFPNV